MPEIIRKHGGYQKMKSFQISQLVYDVTIRFCEHYIDKFSRTRDQMIQAARSGVQNIAESSSASATSKKTELKLTQVARASLKELKLDYEDFLRQKGLPKWERQNPLRQQLIDKRCQNADEVAAWIKETCRKNDKVNHKALYPEYSANAALVLITVACSLLNTHVNRLAEDFENEGGFTERLYRVRKEKREKENKSKRSERSKQSKHSEKDKSS